MRRFFPSLHPKRESQRFAISVIGAHSRKGPAKKERALSLSDCQFLFCKREKRELESCTHTDVLGPRLDSIPLFPRGESKRTDCDVCSSGSSSSIRVTPITSRCVRIHPAIRLRLARNLHGGVAGNRKSGKKEESLKNVLRKVFFLPWVNSILAATRFDGELTLFFQLVRLFNLSAWS